MEARQSCAAKGQTEEITGPSYRLLANPSGHLGEAEDVAIGILEPGDFGAAWGRPDSLCILSGQAVTFKLHASLFESGDSFGDVGNLPAENGERLRLESRRNIGDAEHDAIDVEREGKIILAEDAQTEHAFVEGPRFVSVEGGCESHDFVRAEHGILPVEVGRASELELSRGRKSNQAGTASSDQSDRVADRRGECDSVGTREAISCGGISGAAVDQERGARLGRVGNIRGRARGGHRKLFGAECRAAVFDHDLCAVSYRLVLVVFSR